MQEIEFRGKDDSGIVNHDWLYGSLDNTDPQFPKIMYCDRFWNVCSVIVTPETIGQYTGLKDKNGKKIYEGDIVKAYFAYKTIICVVKWIDCHYVIQSVKDHNYTYSLSQSFELEVIGNIHDKPELLEGGGC